MKTLIVSDLHFSHRFDRTRFEYLVSLFTAADQIIINGDFWDVHACTFDQFLNSPWKKLFPLLKKKKTIYIYGNHDKPHMSDERTNLFSVAQVERYYLTTPKHRLRIEHGHKLLKNYKSDPEWIVSALRSLKYDRWFRVPLEKFLVSRDIQLLHRLHMAKNHAKLLEFARTMTDADILVTGHTHLPEDARADRYINTGFINHDVAYYLLVDDENIAFIKENYRQVKSPQWLQQFDQSSSAPEKPAPAFARK